MRTLNAAQLTAQRAASSEPEFDIVIDADGTPTTFDETEVKKWVTTERVWGSIAEIWLDNSDGSLEGLDYRGLQVDFKLGFNSTDKSQLAPMFVLYNEESVEEGSKIMRLLCIDWMTKFSYMKMGIGGQQLTGTIVGDFPLGTLVEGQTSGAKGRISSVASDRTYVTVTQTTGTFVVEEVQDANNSAYKITVATVTDQSIGTPLDNYEGDTTIAAIITAVLDGTGVAYTQDSTDGIISVYQPIYGVDEATYNPTILQILQDMMKLTKCGIRIENDGNLHVFDLSSVPSPVDYTYTLGGTHTVWKDKSVLNMIVPNRIFAFSYDPVTGERFRGHAEDETMYGLFPVTEFYPCHGVSDDDCDNIAEYVMHRVVWDKQRGGALVPMNIGQELFDYVTIVDSRTSMDMDGYVGGIIRTWTPGTYTMELEIGSMNRSTSIPTGDGEDAGNGPNIPPFGTSNGRKRELLQVAQLPLSTQGYQHDLTFTATDRDTVTWTEGTITFYDGTTQAIASGSYDLADSDIIYIYFDTAHASPTVLKTTKTYNSVMSLTTGLLCLIQKGSVAGFKATVIPSHGKTPLITPDVIDMTGLIAHDYGDGAQLRTLLSTQITAGKIVISSNTDFDSDYDPTDKFDLGDDDLDDIDNGSTYSRLRSTDIDGGHIKLTSSLVANGAWYNESGVIIDADHGIAIYGTDMAFATFADEDDYDDDIYQCKVDSDGNLIAGAGAVIINADGIEITNSTGMKFSYGGSNDGYILVNAAGNLQLGPAAGKVVAIADLILGSLYTASVHETGYIGSTTKAFARVAAKDLYSSSGGVTAYDDKDDIAILRGIKSIKNEQGKDILDAKTLPSEIYEGDVQGQEYINLGGLHGLELGILRAINNRVDELEGKVNGLAARN